MGTKVDLVYWLSVGGNNHRLESLSPLLRLGEDREAHLPSVRSEHKNRATPFIEPNTYRKDCYCSCSFTRGRLSSPVSLVGGGPEDGGGVRCRDVTSPPTAPWNPLGRDPPTTPVFAATPLPVRHRAGSRLRRGPSDVESGTSGPG